MKNAILFSFLSFIFSCSPSLEVKFDKLGISFTCPAGWEITDEQNIDSSGYYLSCERDGFNSSGLLTVSWVNDSVDLLEMLAIYKDELKNNIIYKNSNMSFSNDTDLLFKNNNSKASEYSMTLLGLEHRGVIYCFYGKCKTISILKQEALEDTFENRKGFEIIENSFFSK